MVKSMHPDFKLLWSAVPHEPSHLAQFHSFAELAEDLIMYVPRERRAQLATYINSLLSDYVSEPFDMNEILRRAGFPFYFTPPTDAVELVKAVESALRQ